MARLTKRELSLVGRPLPQQMAIDVRDSVVMSGVSSSYSVRWSNGEMKSSESNNVGYCRRRRTIALEFHNGSLETLNGSRFEFRPAGPRSEVDVVRSEAPGECSR